VGIRGLVPPLAPPVYRTVGHAGKEIPGVKELNSKYAKKNIF